MEGRSWCSLPSTARTLNESIKEKSWRQFQGLGVVPEAAVQDGGTVMTIGRETIESGVGVEIDMDVTGIGREIIVVVAGAAATLLMITGDVAETVCHLHAEA
jgi:hypothetical protein